MKLLFKRALTNMSFALSGLGTCFNRCGRLFSHIPFTSYSLSSERANSLEFPLLLTFKPPRMAAPFVEMGYAPRFLKGTTVTTTTLSPIPVNLPPADQHSTGKTDWPMSHGLVIGGGAQFDLGRLRLSPVLRYAWWASSPIATVTIPGTWQSAQNQVDFLLGVSWRTP